MSKTKRHKSPKRQWEQALIDAQEHDTQLIGKSLHLQCRGLKHDLVRELAEVEAAGGGLKGMLPLMSGQRSKAAYVTGEVETGLFTVGQTIGLIEDVPTMSDLLSGMVEDAKVQLDNVRESLGD